MPSPSRASSSSSPEGADWFSLARFARHERGLWLLAVLLYGVGDTATTFVGLALGGVSEAGPLAGPAMAAFGWGGLIGLKVVLFAAFLVVWSLIAAPRRVAVPLALVIVGGAVTAWNGFVIATAL